MMLMDNLWARKHQRIRNLVEERWCELLYLAPYSPGPNPIKEAFCKVKRLF